MAQSKKPTGVTRVEIPDKQTFGWMMRITRRNKRLLEWFPDKKHGGKVRARAAAAKRYQELVAELPQADISHKNRKTKRNTSGKVGVYAKAGLGRKTNDTPYYSYAAFWIKADGTKEFITFAWLKYGETLARKMACYARDNETRDRLVIFRKFGFRDE